MKGIILLALIAFAAADPEYYVLDKLDMDEMSKNPMELQSYVDCILDRAQCTPLYATYKAKAQEAVEQFCRKCSPYQKHWFWILLQGLKALMPQDYISIRQKYDPENKYFDILEAELKKYAINY